MTKTNNSPYWATGQFKDNNANTRLLTLIDQIKQIAVARPRGGQVLLQDIQEVQDHKQLSDGRDFRTGGEVFYALNGGPHYKFTPAISFFIACADQE